MVGGGFVYVRLSVQGIWEVSTDQRHWVTTESPRVESAFEVLRDRYPGRLPVVGLYAAAR